MDEITYTEQAGSFLRIRIFERYVGSAGFARSANSLRKQISIKKKETQNKNMLQFSRKLPQIDSKYMAQDIENMQNLEPITKGTSLKLQQFNQRKCRIAEEIQK